MEVARSLQLLKFTPKPRPSADSTRTAAKIDLIAEHQQARFIEDVVDELLRRQRDVPAQLARIQKQAVKLLCQLPLEERRALAVDFLHAAFIDTPQDGHDAFGADPQGVA